MICKKCKGKGYIHVNAFGTNGILRCDVCGGYGKIISNQQTNEEWFDELSTEEKAMVIICCCPYESDWFGDNFEKRMEQRIKDISKATYGYEQGVNKIKNWLKKVHNG